jgi:hypothetical protein
MGGKSDFLHDLEGGRKDCQQEPFFLEICLDCVPLVVSCTCVAVKEPQNHMCYSAQGENSSMPPDATLQPNEQHL